VGRLNYTALEITATKSRTAQFMAGINRQWQHMSSTWNRPTRRCSSNDAFASDKLLYMPRGSNEDSLPIQTGTTVHLRSSVAEVPDEFQRTWYALRHRARRQLHRRAVLDRPVVTLVEDPRRGVRPGDGRVVDQRGSVESAGDAHAVRV
jgi:hypothetical protein